MAPRGVDDRSARSDEFVLRRANSRTAALLSNARAGSARLLVLRIRASTSTPALARARDAGGREPCAQSLVATAKQTSIAAGRAQRAANHLRPRAGRRALFLVETRFGAGGVARVSQHARD